LKIYRYGVLIGGILNTDPNKNPPGSNPDKGPLNPGQNSGLNPDPGLNPREPNPDLNPSDPEPSEPGLNLDPEFNPLNEKPDSEPSDPGSTTGRGYESNTINHSLPLVVKVGKIIVYHLPLFNLCLPSQTENSSIIAYGTSLLITASRRSKGSVGVMDYTLFVGIYVQMYTYMYIYTYNCK
jgi:hypothetical protein